MNTFYAFLLQLSLILFLLSRNSNDGERELFRKQKWGSLHVLFITLWINLITIINNYLLRYDNAKYIILMIPYGKHLLIFLGLLALLRYQIRQPIGAFGFKINKKQIYITIIIVLAWHIMLFTIQYLIKGPTGLGSEVFRTEILSPLWNYKIYLFTFVIFGPIIEEIIFRGFFYSPYRKKYGSKVAIILVSLLFSFNHPLKSFGSTFAYSLIFTILYEKTESIVPSIAAHITSNLLLILTPLIIKSML